MSPDREKLLGKSFLEGNHTIGDYTLGPINSTSIMVLQAVDNYLFTEGGDGELTEQQSYYAILEYIFIHSAPIEVVLDLYEDLKAFKKAVLIHCSKISYQQYIEFQKVILEIQDAVAASIVEPIVEDGPGKPPPSPTGSPPSSMPSAAPATPSVNASSSGSSPSPEPSNTSTPPTGPREPPAGSSTSSATERNPPAPPSPDSGEIGCLKHSILNPEEEKHECDDP